MSNSRTLDKKSGSLFYLKTLGPFMEDLDPATCSDAEAAEIGRAMIAYVQLAEYGKSPNIAEMPRQSRIIFKIMEPWKAESEEKFISTSKGRRYAAYCKNTKKKDRLDRYQWEVQIDSKKHPDDYQDENSWYQMPTNDDECSLNRVDSVGVDNIEMENDIDTIISHLNEVCNSNYHSSTKGYRKLIGARLKAGYSVDDCKKVIDAKASQWLGTDMQKYLRPSTLFDETKFESYVNEKKGYQKTSEKDYGEEGEASLWK